MSPELWDYCSEQVFFSAIMIGKSQSHVTDFQPIVNGVITFNTNIKLNIDDSALDTQRVTYFIDHLVLFNAKFYFSWK